MSALLEKKRLLTAVVLVGAFLLFLTTRSWVNGSVVETITGASRPSVKGSELSPPTLAAAIVALASVVALLAARRIGRIIASVLLLISGLLATVAALMVVLDAEGALRGYVENQPGHADARVTAVSVTPWAWIAVAAAALLVVLGVLSLLAGGRWSGLSSSYEAPAAQEMSDWDQLSAGHDPTADDEPDDK